MKIGSNTSMNFSKLIHAILDFIFPPICAACKQRQDVFVHLCPRCRQQLQSKLIVQYHTDESDFTHLSGTWYFDQAITFWLYSDELDQIVHLIKYNGKRKVGRSIGRLAGEALRESGFVQMDMLIPVPLHSRRMWKRGYNQSEWISYGLGAEADIQVRTDLMKRTKYTQTQTQLDAEQRRQNVRNAFKLQRPEEVMGKSIGILDDVITTGATLNECARLLKSVGASRVYGLGLARPRLNFPSTVINP